MFLPKLKELDEQCPSCPYRDGNNKEFGVIVNRLRKRHGIPGAATSWQIGVARIEVRQTGLVTGDFVCHCTAYDQDMNLKPADQHRQCPGATKAFRESKPKTD
jgi:hypothetical protein